MSLQVRHAELLAEVVHAIRVVSPQVLLDHDVEADHCLVADLSLDGAAIQRVMELLEEAFGLVLLPSAILDLVIDGPSVGRLVRKLAEIQQEGKRHAAA